MEKLCNRCQFRTPQTRAICHVCGHNRFTQLDNSKTAVYTTDTPVKNIEAEFDKCTMAIADAFSAMSNKIMSTLRAQFASTLSSVRCAATTPKLATEDPSQTASKMLQNRLPKAVNAPVVAEAPKPAQTPSSPPAAKVSYAPTSSFEFSGSGTVVDLLAPNSDLSTTSAETLAQMDELNRLLQWFRTCGTDNLVLPAGTPRQSTEVQSMDDTINRAA